MNLKAARLVRTPYSEQYALFDLDRTDENFDPLSVGKLDIHYTQQGLYGTLLFWEEADENDSWEDVVEQAELLVAEFQSPMGVPGEYAIEFFSPSLKKYELLSNIDSAESDEPAEESAVLSGSEEYPEEESTAAALDYHSVWSTPTLRSAFDAPEGVGQDAADDEETESADDWPSRVSQRADLPDRLERTGRE